MAGYFYKSNDMVAALGNYDEAFKLVATADNDKLKLAALFSLIFTAAEIDQSRISEVFAVSIKAIEKLPILNAEDKPGTEKYRNYTATITAVDIRLHFALSSLIRRHKSVANDFADAIKRKEIKIIADLVLEIDAIETEQKASEKK